jgi:Na+/proline symporter/CheY-like chemotaxis protein
MIDPVALMTIIFLYIGILFLIALWVERQSHRGPTIAHSPIVYALTIAVYCTSWTFYGSVGNAANSGMLYTTLYLGPTLGIIFWWFVLRKMVRLKNSYRITSIADFISARYDKSQTIAAIATLIAVVGIVPYIALQLKAVTTTFDILTTVSTASSVSVPDVGMLAALLMVVFTIIFGVRRLDATERHQGVVAVLAIESLVKLVAFVAVGLFVTYGLFNGLGDIFGGLTERLQATRQDFTFPTVSAPTWFTYLLLSLSAIMFLPRQFHVAVVENFDEKHIRTAMWLFPLYMFLITFFVLPIAMGGLLLGYPQQQADTFVLQLPLDHGQDLLSVLVFLGGFSAATSMIIVSTMTLSTMVTNHLILPLVDMSGTLQFLRRHLLQCRWLVVALIIYTGYWFNQSVGGSYMLMNMGLIAFAAVLQFAPAMLGGIFWKHGSKWGATLGLSMGFLTWFYTLLLPAFIKSGWLPMSILEQGPWGLTFLQPEQLFGLAGFDNLTHAVIWSLTLNAGSYSIGSLYAGQSENERRLAQDFVHALGSTDMCAIDGLSSERFIPLEAKRQQIEQLLHTYFPHDKAAALSTQALHAPGIAGREHLSIMELTRLHSEVERILAGSIGSAAAHHAVRRSLVLNDREARELSQVYAHMLAELRLTPDEMKKRIDYYQERHNLLQRHAEELEQKVAERTEELRKAKEIAEEARAAAEAANYAKSTFLANMSHELRTPLNAIIGYSEMIIEESADMGADEFIPDLQKIRTAGEHLLSLINNVLDISKIEAGKMDLYLETFDIAEMIETVAITIRPLIEKKHNTLEIDCPRDIGLMHADMTKVRQSIFNLLSNASKFTEQGTISLRVWRATTLQQLQDAPVLLSLNGHGSLVCIEVSDTGIGMSAEQVAKIFDAFTQADVSTTRKYGGTGLGLAITKKFCEMMGGDVTVTSTVGTGTSFTIYLPSEVAENLAPSPEPVTSSAAAPAAPAAPVISAVSSLAPTSAATILVIDDDTTVLDLIQRFLDKQGFRVLTASSGQEGLQLAEEVQPDAITLDVMMPGMDGWSVLSALKASPATADIPVIMLTIVGDRGMAYALGASDYLMKPLERGRLLNVLQKYHQHDPYHGHVLVVEDDEPTRLMVCQILHKEGWHVTSAENGRVALEQMEQACPHLILLDLMMPEMDGFEFMERMHQQPEWQAIPVIVVTAMELTAEDRRRLNGHIEQVLQKGSYHRDELLQHVREFVMSTISSPTSTVEME